MAAGAPEPLSQHPVTHRTAIVGSPVAHSLSPVMHNAGYSALGLTGFRYSAVECPVEEFPAWLRGLRDPTAGGDARWTGLSVTAPLKQVVIPLLDVVTPRARRIGALNTVTWDAAGAAHGENTDAYGIEQALAGGGARPAGRCCLVGAGGTAMSAVDALAAGGGRELTVVARSRRRSEPALRLAAQLGLTTSFAELGSAAAAAALAGAEATVLTLPPAAAADWAAGLDGTASRAGPPGLLLDVTYHPWPTPAVQAWRRTGGTAIGGFEMLVHQAAGQFRLMTGRDAPLDVMREAGQAELTHRS